MTTNGHQPMRLISVNVGLPREVEWRGRTVRTSIWKTAVDGPVRVTALNLAGDAQSDLSVHGGLEKAVYAYPSEHYEYWRQQLQVSDLPWGAFGENLTTEGLLEGTVRIGDRLRAGTVELVVTQPRTPCFKLGIRLNRDDMVKRFMRSRRSGFYLSVVSEGTLTAGDPVEFTRRDEHQITVAEVVDLETDGVTDRTRLHRAIAVPALSEGWKQHFRRRLSGPAD